MKQFQNSIWDREFIPYQISMKMLFNIMHLKDIGYDDKFAQNSSNRNYDFTCRNNNLIQD